MTPAGIPSVTGLVTGAGRGWIFLLIAGSAIMLISISFVFRKAGKPGWAAFVPVYAIFVLLDIVGRPFWWFFLLLIPVFGVVVAVMILHRLSQSFGRSYGITLLLVAGIGWLVLGFGKSKFIGPPR